MEIKIGNLSKTIMQELGIFEQDVVDGINEAGDKIAKAGAKKLRQVSPKKSGDYAKGWTVKTEKEFRQPTKYTIHNKNKPWLAHLLEKGHATRDGGRTKPIVHIAPVEEEIVGEYMQMVEEVIKNGGK